MVTSKSKNSELSSDNGSTSEFSNVSIQENLLILPNRFIQIPNISRVSSYEMKSPCYGCAIGLVLTALVLVTIVGLYHEKLEAFSTLLYIWAIGCLPLAYREISKKKIGIHIVTNGNTSDFLITKNKNSADKLYEMIAYFISVRGKNKSITIDNSFNVTYGDHVLGDKFSDIDNSNIVNRSVV